MNRSKTKNSKRGLTSTPGTMSLYLTRHHQSIEIVALSPRNAAEVFEDSVEVYEIIHPRMDVKLLRI